MRKFRGINVRRLNNIPRGSSGNIAKVLGLSSLVYTRDSELLVIDPFTNELVLSKNPNEKVYATKSGIPYIHVSPAQENLIAVNCAIGRPGTPWTNNELEAVDFCGDPLGGNTASCIIPTAVNSQHYTSQSVTFDGTSEYLIYTVARANGTSFPWLRIEAPATAFPGTPACHYDLSNGTIGTVSAFTDYGIRPIYYGGALWGYLCWASLASDAAVAASPVFYVCDADNSITFAGDATDGIDVWAAGCVQGENYPTSIIRNINLLTYSDHYTEGSSNWSNYRVTITEDAYLTNEGKYAEKVVETATTGTHSIGTFNGPTVVSGREYTFSCRAKKGERSIICLFLYSTFPSNPYFYYDLDTKTVGSVAAGIDDYAIEDLGNDEIQISVVSTASSNDTSVVFYRICETDTGATSPSYLGDGTSGLYMWNAQLNEGNTIVGGTNVASPQYTGTQPGNYRAAVIPYWDAVDVPTWVYNGKFKIRLVPDFDYDELVADAVLLHPNGNAAMVLQFDTATNRFQIIDIATGLCVQSAAVTFSRGDEIEITCDYTNAEITVAGCTTGNGTTSGSQWAWSGDLYVGSTGSGNYFRGFISSPVKV